MQVNLEVDDDVIERAQQALKLGQMTGADGGLKHPTNAYTIINDLLIEIGVAVLTRD